MKKFLSYLKYLGITLCVLIIPGMLLLSILMFFYTKVFSLE